MKRRLVTMLLVLSASVSPLAPVAPAAAAKMKIALLMADKESHGNEVLHKTTAAFFDSKRFDLVERDQLSKIFQERDLTDFIKGSAGDLSNLNGVDIIGVITFSTETTRLSDGSSQTYIFIDVRMTDVRSGQVIASVSSRRSSMVTAPTSVHNASLLLGENIREMFPPEGSVLNIEGREVVVNLGSIDGVKKNDQLEVIHEGKVFFDSEGKAYPPMEEIVATLKVTEVGTQLSKTRAGKNDVLEVGARVRLKKTGGSPMDLLRMSLPVLNLNTIRKAVGK